MKKANLLIVHGGGPTAVMNCSLYGVITESKKYEKIDKVFAAIGGISGILNENFRDLSDESEEILERLVTTPGTAIGTSRYEISDEEYKKMPGIFIRNNIKYVLFNGGNGTMDTCGKVEQVCKGYNIFVVGIPKTIDNDLALIDHAPGYASAANFIVKTTAEIGMDVKSLPIHVSIIESMGRNAGWITAASTLARKEDGDAPHLICLPEVAFDEKKFLSNIKELYEKYGGIVVVVSEGLKNSQGNPIVPPLFESGRSIYPKDVGVYLSELIVEKLGIKARCEKPGLLGRSSILMQSVVDRDEAIQVGRKAVQAVMFGKTGVMVGIERLDEEPYNVIYPLIDLQRVMLNEKMLPPNFYNQEGSDVTNDFIEWAKPLIDKDISNFITFNE